MQEMFVRHIYFQRICWHEKEILQTILLEIISHCAEGIDCIYDVHIDNVLFISNNNSLFLKKLQNTVEKFSVSFSPQVESYKEENEVDHCGQCLTLRNEQSRQDHLFKRAGMPA